MEITETGNTIFARWKGYLTFAEGIQFGDTKLGQATTVPLHGVERFILDDAGKILELDIVHETSSPVRFVKEGLSADQFVAGTSAIDTVREYFKLEEEGEVEALVHLFSPYAVIINAANPVQFGPQGARNYIQAFKDRTHQRKFDIENISFYNDTIMVWWHAQIEFRSGVAFGDIISKKAFKAPLKGVCRFRFNSNGEIEELDVVHETSSVAILARQTCVESLAFH
jgi:hypothetical protein